MNVEGFMESELIAAIGWTLIHSLWQICIVTAGLFFALQVFRYKSSNVRYAVAVTGLAISVVVPLVTFVQISGSARDNGLSVNSGGAAVDRKDIELSRTGDLIAAQTETGVVTSAGSATDVASNIRAWLDRRIPDLLPLAVLAWMAGVGFFSIRLGGGFTQLQKYRLAREPARDAERWAEAFERLRVVTGVQRAVTLRATELIQTPIAIGVFKPVILIPTSLFLQISPRELELIIAHELIHIRRLDPLVNVVQCVIETLFFYHPGVWWICAQIRSEREFATDAAVTDAFRDSHTTYARALANLEEIRLKRIKNCRTTPRRQMEVIS